MRTTTALADTAPAATLADLFARHDRAVLAYSGGKESAVLLRLCEPYRDRLTVAWVNTGAMFPHMADYVHEATTDFAFEEIRSDVTAVMRDYGLPAYVVPVEHCPETTRAPKTPKIQAQPACCLRARNLPLHAYVVERSGATLLLHGQRHGDMGVGRDDPDLITKLYGPTPIEAAAPLWEWSRDDVNAFIAREGIALPDHYAEVDDSLECGCCPALTAKDVPRLAYMDRAYPELATQVRQAMGVVGSAATAVLREQAAVLEGASAHQGVAG